MTDIFPALVAVYPPVVVSSLVSPFLNVGVSDAGGTKFNESRVIVQKNLVTVGSDSPRGAQTVFQQTVAEVFTEGVYTRVLTTEGFLVVYARSKGCGCGSRLRSWNPYGMMSRSNRG